MYQDFFFCFQGFEREGREGRSGQLQVWGVVGVVCVVVSGSLGLAGGWHIISTSLDAACTLAAPRVTSIPSTSGQLNRVIKIIHCLVVTKVPGSGGQSFHFCDKFIKARSSKMFYAKKTVVKRVRGPAGPRSGALGLNKSTWFLGLHLNDRYSRCV